MRRTAAQTFALLLVLVLATLVAPVATADAVDRRSTTNQTDQAVPLVVSVEDGSNYLTIPADEVRRSTSAERTIDVGASVSADGRQLRHRHAGMAIRKTFTSTESASARTTAIRGAVADGEQRLAILERRHRTAIRAFASDEITVKQFLRERLLVDAEARQIRTSLEEVQLTATRTAGYTLPPALDTRIENLKGELESLEGPVASYARQSAAGTVPPGPVYVEATTDGYSIAITTDETYVRETYLGAERRPNATDQFVGGAVHRINVANSRAFELYPWVTNHTVSPTSRALGTSAIYRFKADHTRGQLRAYIDGGTTNVFREAQHLTLTAVRPTSSVNESADDLHVRINRTYPSGPMEITLHHATTGVPIDGTVTVGGHAVGTTGPDGRLWTVQPREPIRVNVTSETGEAVVVVGSS